MIVVLIVYDRFENIKQWINVWKECEQKRELIIIHNYDGSDKIKELCDGVKYIRRENKGLDIGAFKDVCKEQLAGFNNDWDKMLWITDDTFPMRKDFITPYLDKLTGDVGVVCTDLSPFVKTHIRTTGFLIRKEVALKLQFTDILTKEDCYQFEHRSPNAFYEQVLRLGYKVIQVEARETSPLWDSGYKRRLPRGSEHEKVFPKNSKVLFICPVYQSYPQIISSLILQTYQNWELLLIHDGPNTTGLKELINDPRIKYIETEKRAGNWGHSLRQWALTLPTDSDFIVITNADNYHVPVYIEYLLNGFRDNPASVACYCSCMVHSYKAWQIIQCSLKLGFIDCAGVMVRANVAKETGWHDMAHSSDWTYFNDIIKRYGADKWTKINGCLLTHN